MFVRSVSIAISYTLLAAGPVSAQDSPVLTYGRARKSAAINDLVSAFNQIGSHAGQLRVAMPQSDAEAFDAVMLDMMGALLSLPEIRLKTKPTAGTIRPLEFRPNRVPQLTPEVDGLVRFFHQLRKNATDRASRKLFDGAEKSARKMTAALFLCVAHRVESPLSGDPVWCSAKMTR